ncbi:glycosyltransferase [Shewanella holmiensis]|uniref:Glycosyltransferase n=1 Tax=Shewanella holmiensis TaxID=2952222 RepID=A0A9X2WP04_9GAMM|nr:glycosyltransferase [Shewanella holmiensis]MCT7942954.1 glycosyltransferase [Shewanella holmiensis]
MVNIKFISFSFYKGGAAIAALKFHTIAKNILNYEVTTLASENANKVHFLKRLISYSLQYLQRTKNPIKHSLNLFSYKKVILFFKTTSPTVIHLHWINNDTLSIFDLNKIPSGSIVTLHDEWLYCGSEHCYNVYDQSDFFEYGYPLFRRGNFGFPWDYFTWRIKAKNLSGRSDLIYTVPSKWMFDRAKRSVVLKGADIRLLPNPIDTDVFKPNKPEAREQLRLKIGLESKDFVFCFGVSGGKASILKGTRLLAQALYLLKVMLNDDVSCRVKFICFGGKQKGKALYAGFETIYVGHISAPSTLSDIYSAADCVVVPSLVESFGQVAAESLASGTPVISFACSGLTDIVLDKQTGLCAEAYSASSLAEQMRSMLTMSVQDRAQLSLNGRKHVIKQFSYPVIAEHYKEIIEDALNLKNY